MVKGTLLGPEPSTFSSQRAHCLSASRLAPLSSRYASICHFLRRPCPHSFNFPSFSFSSHSWGSIPSIYLPGQRSLQPPTCFYLPALVFPHRCGVSSSAPVHSVIDPSLASFDTQQISHSLLPSRHPPMLLSLCSLKSGDVPSASWMFSNSPHHSATKPFIHASNTVTCSSSQREPASLEHVPGLTSASTLAKYLHDFVFLQRLGKPVAPSHIWIQVAACVLCCVVLAFHFPKRLGFI